jgi:uncharacterized membrane protein YdjX (TVP38/TMEM64 family)
MHDAGTGGASAMGLRRLVPLVLLVLLALAIYGTGLHRFFTFEALSEHRGWLTARVAELGLWAPLAFIGVYAIVTAVSIPGALFLSVLGGFLFGTALGSVCDLVGATTGGTTVFLIARSSFGDALRRRAGPFMRRVEAGFRDNAASYLLVLRLVPLFPFWLVNLVPAFFGVRLGTFVLCTFIGMIPAAVIYAGIGAGLGGMLDRGEAPDLGAIFEPHVLIPLLGLALLATTPALHRWWKRTR